MEQYAWEMLILGWGAVGVVSWYLIREMRIDIKACRTASEKKVTECQLNHVPRPEYRDKVDTLKTDVSEIKSCIEKIHARINDLPGNLKKLFDTERSLKS